MIKYKFSPLFKILVRWGFGVLGKWEYFISPAEE